ncbi:MAG: hypothetical protein ACREON_18275 [Gemmatimonadaceae bacterium]
MERKGGGPGEFERMGWFSRFTGDSLAVFDWNTRRLSIFDSAGKFVRSVTLESRETISLASPIGWFGAESLLAERMRLFGPGEERTGVIGDSMLYLRYDAAGKIADTLDFFPGRETYVQTGGSGKGSFVTVTMLPFGREPAATTHDGRLYFGASDRYEIGVYSPDGRLERIIRRPVRNMEVTASIPSAFLAGLRDIVVVAWGPACRSIAWSHLPFTAIGFSWVRT